MPAPSPTGQPDAAPGWFREPAGQTLLQSQAQAAVDCLAQTRGLAWLWLAPAPAGPGEPPAVGRGLRLVTAAGGWGGAVRCALPLPLASESIGAIVLQHVLQRGPAGSDLLQECARVLEPGAWLALFALNPLAPYRWRWRGAGLRAAEPLVWRRRLRAVGLVPEPLSQGIGPSWRPQVVPALQAGAGLRAAYLIRAQKRSLPMTPARGRSRIAAPAAGVPATFGARHMEPDA